MKFYDCKTAPSPRRARIFIAEKNIPVEHIEVDLRNAEQMSDAFRAINPYCTVPVLELDDGTHLTTTAGIWQYLEAAYPEPALMGKTAEQKGIIADLQWRIETGGFMAMSEYLRNSAPAMKGRALTGTVNYEQIPELAVRGQDRLTHFFNDIDELVGTKPYVAGETFSVADIDLLVVVDFAKWRKITLPETAVNAWRWYETVSARPSAQSAEPVSR
ncbi:MAG TPA: glutathione S-transferase family protein [Gammaproteobacteria bacterium]|jgi:glutathione S-transferase|nr:glutathione S-transferase family protein [Gammaproteobacteria bacterium]HIN60476.1 glutathione S-transferase family protein [Gammaproteobacteria bacterium]|tara:strand:- start:535 stop:1182 length:648 start_codon:yes stop_codon:yes gene_type:complete